MYFKLAWRNIWRNKLRTLLSIGGVAMAFFLCSLIGSMQMGTHESMTESMLKSTVGYIQIHKEGYFETKDINQALLIENIDEIENKHPAIQAIAPRIEGFALASLDSSSKPVMVLGMDTIKEKYLSKLNTRMDTGIYFEQNSIVINHTMAKKMKLNVGDSIALLGYGYHASSAVGLYKIGGITRIVIAGQSAVFMPFEMASEFFDTHGQASTYFVALDNSEKDLIAAQEAIKASVDTSEVKVMNWKEMIPDIQAQFEFENSTNAIMAGILYMIVTFGLFGTILMMTEERKREFGILLGIGMTKTRLSVVLILEGILISFMGIAASILPTIGIITYFILEPIQLPGEQVQIMEDMGFEAVYSFSTDSSIFISQMIIVISIALATSLYPLIKIATLNIIKSINS